MSSKHVHHYHRIVGVWRPGGKLEPLDGMIGAIEHDHDVETGNFGGRHYHSRYALPEGQGIGMLAVWSLELPEPKIPST